MIGHNEYMKLELAKNYITDRLYPEELLAQLAEEASEVADVALLVNLLKLDGDPGELRRIHGS